ncbi:MAG: hypothetical protein HLUCCA09_03205 [Rhodobacteraceae bacterium HLUCCA09]|nr:MAG: hypothetical protein HLUCCA09_03205 [Rhodobacteraceae bacterium HLUCCA09]
MSFVRPEALAALTRWREVALALAFAVFGLWVATRGGYFYAVLGGAICAFALGLALAAWRRLRFAPGADAPGVVEIDEGAIAYFGPETGGVVALSELDEVQATAHSSGLAWRLHQSDGTTLTIPAAARGADQLFDVFGALPGASTRTFLAAVEQPPAGTRRLWRRRAGAHEPRLPRP